jgi:hypothetical protein
MRLSPLMTPPLFDLFIGEARRGVDRQGEKKTVDSLY